MKKRRTPTKAEREAMDSYQALLRKWESVPKFARGQFQRRSESTIPKLQAPPGRSTGREYASVDTGFNGGTKPIEQLRYTGDKLIGVGVMHKSNLVPVFKGEDAVDIARMRRG